MNHDAVGRERIVTSPHISIVVPAFNEEGRIAATLERLGAYLAEQGYTWEVMVVDDGSADGTARVVAKWADGHEGVRLQYLPHQGKGWAVKHGMLAATGRYRFMCDADLAMPVNFLSAFLDHMNEGYDIVIGSRQLPGARRFNEPFLRHAMGRVFNWAVRLMAVRGVQDSQYGFKCFTAEAAEMLFGLQRTSGFGFDVEVLYLARKGGLRVLEIPVDWYHQRDSKVRPGIDSFAMARDIMLTRWYDLLGKYPLRKASVKDRGVIG